MYMYIHFYFLFNVYCIIYIYYDFSPSLKEGVSFGAIVNLIVILYNINKKFKVEKNMKKINLILIVSIMNIFGCVQSDPIQEEESRKYINSLKFSCVSVGNQYYVNFMERCENKEVVCYNKDGKGVSCFLKK